MLEIRNDLIAETAGQRQWAERIAGVIVEGMDGEGLSYGT
jgi:predicted N-formylglutamate amidohydrolase